MSDILLAGVIVALLVERYFTNRATAKQHKDLLRLIKAKSLEEVTQAELVDKVEPDRKPAVDPDMIPTEQLTDEQFDKMIGDVNERN